MEFIRHKLFRQSFQKVSIRRGSLVRDESSRYHRKALFGEKASYSPNYSANKGGIIIDYLVPVWLFGTEHI